MDKNSLIVFSIFIRIFKSIVILYSFVHKDSSHRKKTNESQLGWI